MALSIEEVRRIAALARLKLSPEEEETFRGQLSAILDHVSVLAELDVSNVEPMTHALAEASGAGELRRDEVRPGLSKEAALMNAPAKDGTAFQVPRIIE